MPKLTFLNLCDEKKQVLIKALEQEFSRVPLYNASISNIIKSAQIPRGSFYQYFENKEDAYFYLLNERVAKIKEQFIACLMKRDGDLLQAMVDMFAITSKELSKGKQIHFFKNTLLNMTHEVENSFHKIFNADGSMNKFQQISSLINKDLLNISSDQELYHVMKIIASVTIRNLIEKAAHNLSDQEAMDAYLLEMELLKKGLYKNE